MLVAKDSSIRIAMLGSGFTGRTHAANLARIPGVEVCGVCSLDEAGARALIGKSWPRAAFHRDFAGMLDALRPDAVFICVPPGSHEGQLEEAARRGMHVFVEKPIALTLERARSMVDAVRSAGVVSQVGYHMRFGAPVERLAAMIASGAAGRPTLFQGRFFCNSLHTDWWRDTRRGGGQVVEQAIHVYDLALHLLGEPKTAGGFMANLCHGTVPDYSVDDTSMSVVRFRGGALAGIAASNCAVPTTWEAAFTVVCEKVTAMFTSPGNAVFYHLEGQGARQEVVSSGDDLYLREVEDFIAAIRGRRTARSPIDEGFAGLALVLAVAESSRSDGRPVVVPRL
jgi:predicted dehydrogenase